MIQQLRSATDTPVAPMAIRGRLITDELVEMGGRGGDLKFRTPDVHKYVDEIPLRSPSDLSDLYEISFGEVLDYLANLGDHLRIESNAHLQRACRLSYLTAPTTPPIIDKVYGTLHRLFLRERVRELADETIGIDYLEGWVEKELSTGIRIAVRCFGSRALHIVAGNSPTVSVQTIIRNIILRSDAIIKTPSNDPFTALAIAQTMIDIAPDHPITKHLTVAYWRGGDEAFEEKLYQPHRIEKIVAWGGFSSLKHVTRYIQPGLELIALDPKRSTSVIGKEAFENDATMRDVARRLATDIGAMNQVGCVNSRVSYLMTGTDDHGIKTINKFGQYVYDALMGLPETTSTKPKLYDRDLKEHVDALRLAGDWFHVVGGRNGEGAIIVSQISDAVEFSTLLNDRTANLVPIDSTDDLLAAVNSYTQTVGVYPESLKDQLLNILPLYGAQRFVSLGFALQTTEGVAPHDGIEIMRRMGKWIVNETCMPEKVPPLWEQRSSNPFSLPEETGARPLASLMAKLQVTKEPGSVR
jgi:hypothetical protein